MRERAAEIKRAADKVSGLKDVVLSAEGREQMKSGHRGEKFSEQRFSNMFYSSGFMHIRVM